MSSEDHRREELMAALQAALREVSGLGVLFANAAADELGLNPTDLECLGYLNDGPMSAGALAAATGLTSGAITGVIDRLERAGFAQREPDRSDRRKVLVRETAKARARTAPIFAPMAKASAAVLAGYSDEELQLLLGFLEKSRDASLTVLARLRQGRAGSEPPFAQG